MKSVCVCVFVICIILLKVNPSLGKAHMQHLICGKVPLFNESVSEDFWRSMQINSNNTVINTPEEIAFHKC